MSPFIIICCAALAIAYLHLNYQALHAKNRETEVELREVQANAIIYRADPKFARSLGIRRMSWSVAHRKYVVSQKHSILPAGLAFVELPGRRRSHPPLPPSRPPGPLRS